MASSILLYKKTVGDLTWAILGDPSYSMDWFNTAGDTPAKATLRIYSKDDSKLTAIMNNLNNKVVFQFDDQDFYDCIFFNILWYGRSMLGDIYEEFESTKLGKGSDGESGPWFPSGFSFIPDDAVFGDDDPTIYEDYTYFKVYDYEATRGSGVADGFDLSVKMILALSSTGEGNPEKMVYYQGDLKLSDLADCVYKKITHYYDLGGSSGDTVAKTWADYFDTLDVGDDGKVYDPDKTPTTQTDTMEISDKGAADPDTGLKYIEYSETTEGGIADPTKTLSPAYDSSKLSTYFQHYGELPMLNDDGTINATKWGSKGSGTTGFSLITDGTGYYDCPGKPYFMQRLVSDSDSDLNAIMIVDKAYAISYSIIFRKSRMISDIGKDDPVEYFTEYMPAFVKNRDNWPDYLPDDWILVGDNYVNFVKQFYDNPSAVKTVKTGASSAPYVCANGGSSGIKGTTYRGNLVLPLKSTIGLDDTIYIGYINREDTYWSDTDTLSNFNSYDVHFCWDPLWLYEEFGLQMIVNAPGHMSASDANMMSCVASIVTNSPSSTIATSMLKSGWSDCELSWTSDIAECVEMLKAHDGDRAYTYKTNGETILERYYYMQNGEDAYIHKAT